MNPTAPSQPPLDTAYSQPSNPSTTTASEDATAQQTSNSAQEIDSRKPNDVPVPLSHAQGATPSSLGYGVRGSGQDKSDDEIPPGLPDSTDAEQMAAPGEGDIAKAQDNKHGFGEQADMASDLDRKKSEQAQLKQGGGSEGKGSGVDVGAALSGDGKVVVGAGEKGKGLGAGGEGRGVGGDDP
ncbi:hypothetical protein MMC12_007909 [Toensbergia leucococca]|nr:hypothetical protein [Toensbergia leucococca]